MKIFLSLLLEADVNKLRQVIESVLTKHYVSLHELRWNRLHQLADLMYDADIISFDIKQSPSFNNILTRLMVQLSSIRSISQIEQYCTKFLSILNDVGGSCALVSQALQQDWIKDSRAECGVELQLGV